MPNREVVIKVTTQTEEADSKIRSVGESVKGLAPAAETAAASMDRAGESVAKLGTDGAAAGAAAVAGLDPVDVIIKRINKAADAGTLTTAQLKGEFAKLPGPVGEVAKRVVDVTDALVKMDAKKDSPAGLGRAAALAQVKLEDLRAEIDKAAAAGVKFGPEVARGLQTFERQIDSAVVRSGRMKDTMGDLATQGKLSAQSMTTLAGSMGSLQGVFQLADDAGKGWVSTAGKIGLGAFAAVEGIKLLKEVLQAWADTTKAVSDKLVEMVAKQEDARVASLQLTEAQRAVKSGLIEAQATIGATIERWKSYVEETRRSEEATRAFGTAVAGMKAPEKFQEVQDKAVKMNIALALALGKSKESLLEWATANESDLKKVEEAYRIRGEKIPAFLQKAIDAMKEWQKHLDQERDLIERGKKAIEAKGEAYARSVKQMQDVGKAVADIQKGASEEIKAANDTAMAAIKSSQQKLKALNEETLSDEEYNKRKKAITAETSAAILSAADKETTAQKKAEDQLSDVAAQYGLTGEQLKILIVQYADYTKNVDAAHKGMDGVKDTVKELAERFTQNTTPLKDNKTQMDALKAAVGPLKTNIDGLAESARVAKEAFDGMAKAIGQARDMAAK